VRKAVLGYWIAYEQWNFVLVPRKMNLPPRPGTIVLFETCVIDVL
jgi:hypothetical protein